MNKVVGSAAAAAVVLGGAGLAWWSGTKVTEQLQTQSAKMLEKFPSVKLVEQKVQRGFMHSSHELTMELACIKQNSEATPLHLTVRNTIQHGPFPGAKSVGLAAIDSDVVWPTDVSAQLTKFFGNQSPLHARTVLGFWGGYTSNITSPTFKYKEGDTELNWQGLTLSLHGSTDNGVTVQGTSYILDMPGVDLQMAPGSLKLDHLKMQGEVHTGGATASGWIMPAKGTGSIAALEVNTKKTRPNDPHVIVENFNFSQEQKIDQGFLSSSVNMNTKMRIDDDLVIDQITLQGSNRHLHVPTYNRMIEHLLSQVTHCDQKADTQEQMQAAAKNIEADLSELMRHQPEYAVDKLAVSVGGKSAELSYKFSIKEMSEADSALPMPALLESKGAAQAKLKVQNGFIEQVMLQPKAPAEMAGIVNQAIDEAVTQGFLVREAEAYTVDFEFKDGAAVLNGKPMPSLMGIHK